MSLWGYNQKNVGKSCWFVPDWFVTLKMLEDLPYHLFFNDLDPDYQSDDSIDDDDYDYIINLKPI